MFGRWTRGRPGSAGAPGAGGTYPVAGVPEWHASARYYSLGVVHATGMGQFATVVDSLWAFPFQVGRNCTADSLNMWNQATATAKLRYGIYTAKAGTLYPDALLVDSGEFDASVAGEKTVAVNLALTAGTWYWHAFLVGTAAPNLWGCPTSSRVISPIGWPSGGITGAHYCNLRVARAYGALPATFPAGGVPNQDGAGVLFARFSA